MEKFNQFNFQELTHINVLLIPINIDDGEFIKKCDIIKRTTSFNMLESIHSFKKWKLGKVTLGYHLYHSDFTPTTEYLWNQKIVTAIGIAKYDGTTDIPGLHAAFNALTAAYPSIISKTLLIIDPSATQTTDDSDIFICCSDVPELITSIVHSHILPSSLQLVIKSYEATVSSSAAASSAAANEPLITTPIDYGKRNESHVRKQRTHRQQKRAADLALQAGQWDAALRAYEDVADAARSAGDWEWAGAALEAQCAIAATRGGLGAARAREDEIVRKASDALAFYAKRISALEGESQHIPAAVAAQRAIAWAALALHLRLARFKASLGGAKESAAEWLTAAYNLGTRVFQGAPEERAKLFAAVAAVYKEMGFRRKFAFYAWLAAGALAEAIPQAEESGGSGGMLAAAAHRALEQAGGELGLGLLLGRTHDPVFEAKKKPTFWGGISVPFTFGDWKELQIPTLIELVGLARQVGDRRLTAIYSMYALANHSASLPPDAQEDLALEIVKAAAGTDHPIDISGVVLPVPNIVSVKPIAVKGNYMLIPPKEGSSGPFIYTPTIIK